MIDFSAYVFETLKEDGELILRRAQRKSDRSSLLVVEAVSELPSIRSLAQLEHEYLLREELDPNWAARPIELGRRADLPALVLQDPGGKPLSNLLGKPLPLTEFLRLAIALADTLEKLHASNLVHKNIKPANVLADPATGKVWLTGFGIASRLPRERQLPEPPEVINGTLAYMAPEQTGRMNRSIDSRSDLYSLGVTLYEMLTGVLPFSASDAMEWVHCHIARRPPPPAVRRQEVPETLSAIVLKLLAKTAEERYQTAAGLEADLRECLGDWESLGGIRPIPPGLHDASDRLLIPEKLYGRDRDVEALLEAFHRVVMHGTQEFVLVSGHSGVGKSSVVNELQKAIVLPRGMFISGKFDQFRRDVPYVTFAQACRSLVRQFLGKREEEVAPWRDAVREAAGSSGRLLIDLIPELELVIGKQPAVPDLPPDEARNRLHVLFRRFLAACAQEKHPLVFFIDDLQWLDAATLKLLEHVVTDPDLRYFLLVGAYRDNEVTPSHPLRLMLDSLRQSDVVMSEIVLKPLSLTDLCSLVGDALRCDRFAAEPLAQLICEKTDGNPFFAIQFLTALVDERLLEFDAWKGSWKWDLDRLRAKRFTENVVDLMIGKLQRLPAATQEGLKRLACFGSFAGITNLTRVGGGSEEELHRDLWEAVREGFLFRTNDSYKFSHDRIQEAAYALIPEESRAEVHLRIGRQLYSSMTSEEIAENVFRVVNQLNAGAALITERTEKERVAELNLAAGRKTKASAVYGLARDYFALGMAMARRISWERRYDLALSLWLERAECEFLTGNLETAERLISEVLRKAKSKPDKAAAYRLRVQLYVMKTQNTRAVDIALECLRLFGIEMPPHPTPHQVQNEYEEVWKNLKGRSIASLTELPRMSDLDMQAAMSVLSTLLAPAFNTDNNLFRLLVCHMVNVSVKYGTTAASTHGYAWFGVILGPVFHRYKDAYRFGELAVDLVEKYNFLGWKAKVYFAMESVLLWTQPLNSAIDFVRAAFLTALETGDLTFACYSTQHLVDDMLLRGEHLDQVWLESAKAHDFARNAKFRDVAEVVLSIQRFVQNVRGQNGGSTADAEDERAFEARLLESPMPTKLCWYWILRLRAHFMSGDYAAAIAAGQKARALLWASEGHIQLLDYCYYTALSAAAFWKEAPPDKQSELLELLIQHVAQLKEWAENCPSTFRDKYALAAAEFARIKGRDLKAMRLYEEAIQSAHENGFIQNEGIGCEIAARFYLNRGFKSTANSHVRQARSCYLRWGAHGKVKQLDQLYPGLKELLPPGPTITISTSIEQLDLATVVKALQAVSREIELGKLIETLMAIAVGCAGAERGLLFLTHGQECRTVAEATTRDDKVQVNFAQTFPTLPKFPESILRYVIRTRERVILGDASAESSFSHDEYIRVGHLRSILCLPLVKMSALIGVLYLENNLTPRVFTTSRLAVLELLASQAAISLENARLYADLRQENSERSKAEEALRAGEERMNLAAEAAKLAMWEWDMVKDEIWMTDKGRALFGIGLGERIDYAALMARVHPEDRATRDEAIRRALDPRGEYAMEYRVVLPDGQVRWMTGLGRFEFGGGKPLWMRGVSLDITERKQAEMEAARQRSASERQLQDIVDNTTSIIFVKDLELRYLLVNREYERRFNVRRKEICGKSDFDLFPQAFAEAFRANDRQVIEAGEPIEFEESVSSGGRDRHYVVVKFLLRDRAEKPYAVCGIATDITAKLAKEAAEGATRAKSEFLATMSHEIRTPMNGVIGMTGLLLDTRLSPEQREFAESIRFSAEALLTIINDILDFSKIEAGKLTLELVNFDLLQTIESTLDIVAPRASEKRIELISSVPPDIPRGLRGDPGRVRQILTNLIGNAVKFTDRGEVVVRVSQESETETETVLKFCVHDTGIGIAPEVQAKLFEAFSQGDHSTTRRYGGTGLGLMIAKRLTELMRGEIGVESQLGHGSTFWFTVRFEKVSADATKTYHGDLSSVRALVIDDNATNREILRRQVLAWRIQTSSAGNGPDALQKLRNAVNEGNPYDLALLDWHMPEMDGLALARAIKADPAIAGTRLVLLTSLEYTPNPEELASGDIETCLVKPIKQSRLFDCLVNVMGKAAASVYVADSARHSLSTNSPRPDQPRASARILLAEDNHINQRVALGQLYRLGYDADVVTDGVEVLEALQSKSYDIILMDCQMPRMDGFEATRAIRIEEQGFQTKSPIHIVAITANAGRGDREKCLAAGMNDYVSKPIQTEELQAVLERWKTGNQTDNRDLVSSESATQGSASGSVSSIHQVPLPGSSADAPVDMQRLAEFSGGPEELPEMIRLYLEQSHQLIEDLGVAIRSGMAGEVLRCAHKLLGSSANCGMTAVLPALRELEAMGRTGQLEQAEKAYANASQQLERIKEFLRQ